MSGKELTYINEVFKSNFIAPVGEFIDRFERSVEEYTHAGNAVALCNATSALHLALRVLGIRDSKVAVSTFTFIGSVNPILYENNEPVFIDVDESWHMDPALLERAIEQNDIRALVLPHIYGQVADIDSIADLCRKNDIVLIEDAAESLGAFYKGRHSGTFGKAGCFSFNGNKMLSTSGGGMLVSDEKEVAQRAKFLSTQAKESDFVEYVHKEVGYNYRLSNVLAAIGVAQMEVLEERVMKKREIFSWYEELLPECFMPELPDTRGTRWLTTLTFEKRDPFSIMERLHARGIESRPLWKPMHTQPLFSGTKAYLNGRSEELFSKGLCLPSGTMLTKKDVRMICEAVRSV